MVSRPGPAATDGGDAGEVRWLWLALVVAIVLVVQPGRPGAGGLTILVAGALGAVLAASLRWPVPLVAAAVMVAAGVAFRLAVTNHAGSDVLDVTDAAIDQVLSGGSPYGVTYEASRPPGASFPYGPLALLWYLPVVGHGWWLEIASAVVVLVLLAVRGRLFGLAIYAFWPTLIVLAGDGSNDTSVGLWLLAAFIVAGRSRVAGAVLLAACVAFKPYAAAWAPAYLVWGGWEAILAFGLASAVAWSPVLLSWGVGAFLASVQRANEVHATPYFSLAAVWEMVLGRRADRPAFDAFRLVLGFVTAVVTLRLARSLDAVILVGTLVYLVTLYAGYWSTYAYVAAIAPVLCWRVDDWLGLPTHPIGSLEGGAAPA